MLDETSPLLGVQQKDRSRWSGIYWLCPVFLAISAAGSVLNVPLTQLVEDNICSRYFPHSDQAERNCKTAEIQTEVAYLTGNLFLIMAVVGLTVAFPFSTLADRIGRKPVVLLAIIGSSLAVIWELGVVAFPKIISVQAMIAGPLFMILGGGNTVLLAILFSIASELMTQSDRASAFFLVAFSGLVGSSLGPAISSQLMEHYTPWTAAYASLFVNLSSLIPLSFVPETLSSAKSDTNVADDGDINSADSQPEESQPRSFKARLSRSLQYPVASLPSLKSYSLLIVLSTFLTVIPEALGTSQFMAQYISKRFAWPLAKTGYLLTFRGFIHMAVLLFILPLLSKLLLRYYSTATKDLILVRVSVAFAGAGALFMAAPQIGILMGGLAVHSLGSGIAPLCRSLATTYVAPQDTSKLNTIIGMVEMSGSLFAGPALAWSFDTGMNVGGLLLGLPYFGLAGVFALSLIGLCFVRTPVSEEMIDTD